MKTTDYRTNTVGEIVRLNFKAAEVFNNHGIDFCCGGKVSLADACESGNCDIDLIIHELEALNTGNGNAVHNFDAWGIGFLSDYIKNTHHQYVKTEIPLILPLAKKVAEVHGENHSELIRISELFQDLAEELTSHLNKEEQILFPYVKKMEEEQLAGKCSGPNCFGSIESPISVMEAEHENAGVILKEMFRLSNGYMVPDDACNTFRLLFDKMKAFENDLHQHIHLENNILFPKAIQMEKIYSEVG